MNLPNILTVGRLGLSLLYFVLLSFHTREAILWGGGLFIVAGFTDLLDGWLARRHNQETRFGRLADPFVDKVMICGSFIFFLSFPPVWVQLSGINPWVVLAIVGRELLVSSLRDMVEAQGEAFGAAWFGKWKLGLQVAAVLAVLLFFYAGAPAQWSFWMKGLVWGTAVVTVLSAAGYITAAARVMRNIE